MKRLTLKRLRFILVLLAIAGYLHPSFATTFYVAAPSEIAAVLSKLAPGDSVVMRNGNWQDAYIYFQAIGSEEASITLCAETPGHVILTGNSRLKISGHYLTVSGLKFSNGFPVSGHVIEFLRGSTHCRLTDTQIIHYDPPDKNKNYKWVSMHGQHHRVDHCSFFGQNHIGVTLTVWLNGQPTYHLIDHNYFGHRAEGSGNGYETIRIGTSEWSQTNSRTTVEYNLFEECNGEIEIISNKSCENVFRYNTFLRCKGTLTLRHGKRCLVQGNFFLGEETEGSGGVRIIDQGHKVINNYFHGLRGDGYRSAIALVNGVPNSPLNRYFQVRDALIAFNTFVDNHRNFTIGAGADNEKTLPPADCRIANNIVLGADAPLVDIVAEPINLQWLGNIMFGAGLGFERPDGIEIVDPQLFLAADGLWRPDGLSSPAIDAAQGEFAEVVDDIDGQLRNDARKDIGCDEYSTAAIIRRPLTPAEVGPSWLSNPDLPVVLIVKTSGPGRVQIDPPGGIYKSGTVVTLTAIADSGSTFTGWSGDVGGAENPLQLVMDGDKIVTANFVGPAEYRLAIWKVGSGRVILDPPGGLYTEGTVVTLLAVPDSGWAFKNWGGALNSTNNPEKLVMDGDKSVIVTFMQQTMMDATDDESPSFYLAQNYPNPFNPTTTIRFVLPEPSKTRLIVYDVKGQERAVLADEFLLAGEYRFVFDGSNLPTGLYVYRLQAGKFLARGKMLLIR